jgi:inward rectifier potassium channel
MALFIKKQEHDLGLGSKVVQQNKKRFINRDGSLNVYQKGAFERGSFSPYHAILRMSWWSFYTWLAVLFIAANILFVTLYLLAGPHAFPELTRLSLSQKFAQLFFFSIQIITTLASSPLHPVTTMGNIVLSVEAVAGLLGFALSMSLIFTRFSNPATKIIFSENAVITPYNDINGFMFRIINGRNNELIEVTATVTLTMLDKDGNRQFQQLSLERDKVLVFPLNWTIVHPIDTTSPIFEMTLQDLAKADAEFLIYITAVDKYLSKTVYARFSYLYDEIVEGARFVPMIERSADGTVLANPHRIHQIEKIS